MKTKKILITIFLLLALGLVACGGETTEESAPPTLTMPAEEAPALEATEVAIPEPEEVPSFPDYLEKVLPAGEEKPISWKQDFHLQFPCGDSTEIRILALDGLRNSKTEVSVRGIGWLVDKDSIAFEACGVLKEVGIIRIYDDINSANGIGVSFYLYDVAVDIVEEPFN